MNPFNSPERPSKGNIINSLNSFQNLSGIMPNLPFLRNGLMPEEENEEQDNNIIPENSLIANAIFTAQDTLGVDNTFNELSNQILESHPENFVNNIDPNNPSTKTKIFKVVYQSHLSLFEHGIYDHYSENIIKETLNEMNNGKIKKVINEKNEKNLVKLQDKPKKKQKYIFKRKENSDNIRKKVKSRFFKTLKNIINQNLKEAGSKLFFDFLPQPIISNITRHENRNIFNMTLKEIYSGNFNYEKNGIVKDSIRKYRYNLLVLEYLEKNITISEKSNFHIFKDMKLSQIYKDYLSSKQFALSISNLQKENENEKYIKDYIIKAHTLLNYYGISTKIFLVT